MFGFNDYPLNHFLEVLRSRYREGNKDVDFLPFYYNCDFLPIAANATVPVTNSTDQDADFIVFCTMQAAHEDGTVNHVQFPNMTVLITSQVAGRQIQDRATALINVFGRGQRPFPWPRPWVIPAKSSWTTLVSNLHPATDVSLRLTYGGVKAIPIPLR